MRRILIAAAAVLAGASVRPTTPEEHIANLEKIAVRDRAHEQARREYWGGIEARNAAKVDGALNRWTGKPHNHARAKARQLARIAKLKARRAE